jgi:hypothetical protein
VFPTRGGVCAVCKVKYICANKLRIVHPQGVTISKCFPKHRAMKLSVSQLGRVDIHLLLPTFYQVSHVYSVTYLPMGRKAYCNSIIAVGAQGLKIHSLLLSTGCRNKGHLARPLDRQGTIFTELHPLCHLSCGKLSLSNVEPKAVSLRRQCLFATLWTSWECKGARSRE